MKLYKFVLLAVIIISLLLGTKTTREGAKSKSKAKAEAKAKAKAEAEAKKQRREYGGIFAIETQIKLLKQIKDRMKGIPSFEIEPKVRREINNSLDLIYNKLTTWYNMRIQYLIQNNKTPIAPSDNASIDGLRKMWIDNGFGLKVLVDGIIERLNISEDSQNDVDKLLKTFVTGMNMELGIVIPDTKQTDSDNIDGGGGGYFEDSMDEISDIFGEGGIVFDFLEKENLTYEERYS